MDLRIGQTKEPEFLKVIHTGPREKLECDTNFSLKIIQFPVDLNQFQTRKIETGKNTDFPGI